MTVKTPAIYLFIWSCTCMDAAKLCFIYVGLGQRAF